MKLKVVLQHKALQNVRFTDTVQNTKDRISFATYNYSDPGAEKDDACKLSLIVLANLEEEEDQNRTVFQEQETSQTLDKVLTMK